MNYRCRIPRAVVYVFQTIIGAISVSCENFVDFSSPGNAAAIGEEAGRLRAMLKAGLLPEGE